ncbi:beta-1,4-N-acetylgalactosaminyltransferase bre-4-like [Adelges cooleyi]|uniref:beta-1,4-N-acetylgalactosaminyltransferase bre-4-like n=1 Tax=Adelges cooleyi TaxID=133065 RepID=UPI00217FA8B7|nr:beta-1,4-N-acetylgalactosaminyltransferase bre-4-like [Adelges cooleyi]
MKLILHYIKRRVLLHWLFKICALCAFLIVGIVAYIVFFPAIIYIKSNDIPNYLVNTNTGENEMSNMSICPIAQINDQLELLHVHDNVSEEQLNLLSQSVSPGGKWAPSNCISQHHTAIVICYRNRTEQLNIFLYHMHSFLQKQNIQYEIFVIEQTFDEEFNRGKLFNVGYREITMQSSAGCFIFHDVDLMPENINNIYGCTIYPRHMSTSINIFNYTLPYRTIFGGAIALTRNQYYNINGFSNVFYGWGGEDDDMFNRVFHEGYKVCRYQSYISRYTMLAHSKETPNENRMNQLRKGYQRFKTDGVNSVTYKLILNQKLPLYTRILVSL